MTYLSFHNKGKTVSQKAVLTKAMNYINDLSDMRTDRNYLGDIFQVVEFCLYNKIGSDSHMIEDTESDEFHGTCDITGLGSDCVTVEIESNTYQLGRQQRYLLQGILNGAYSTDELLEQLHSDESKEIGQSLLDLADGGDGDRSFTVIQIPISK